MRISSIFTSILMTKIKIPFLILSRLDYRVTKLQLSLQNKIVKNMLWKCLSAHKLILPTVLSVASKIRRH